VVIVRLQNNTPWTNKTIPLIIVHNLCEYRPIFAILSPIFSQENSTHLWQKRSPLIHCTVTLPFEIWRRYAEYITFLQQHRASREHRARERVDEIKQTTAKLYCTLSVVVQQFRSKPIDCVAWEDRIHKKQIKNVEELWQRVEKEWDGLDQRGLSLQSCS